MKLTRFQSTVLARLLARDLSGASMKVDCRSLDGLERRGLVEYSGKTTDLTEDGRTRHSQPFIESTAAVTDAGRALMGEGGPLRAGVRSHLRLERDRALTEAANLEDQAARLRIKAAKWEDALNQEEA